MQNTCTQGTWVGRGLTGYARARSSRLRNRPDQALHIGGELGVGRGRTPARVHPALDNLHMRS